MIDFNTYRLLNESLGMHNLGLRPTQSLGLRSNLPGFGESGMGQDIPMPHKKKFDLGMSDKFGASDEMEDEENPEDMPDEDHDSEDTEDHDDEEGFDDDEDSLEDEEGDEEEFEDDHDEEDHEDDMNEPGLGDEMGREPFKKKTAITAFMKKESCEDNEEEDGELKDKKGEEKDGPVFMMKKSKKCSDGKMDKKMKSKKCGDGEKLMLDKAKKCDDGGMMPMKKNSKKMKESVYGRPASWDNSEEAWFKSIGEQLDSINVRKKHATGLETLTKEDMLLAPTNGGLESIPEPKVDTKPDSSDLGFTVEAVQEILKRLDKLEQDK